MYIDQVGLPLSSQSGPMSGHDIEGLQSDRVQVAVRVRPASLSEKCGQYKAMVKVTGENVLCFDPDQTEDGHVITPTTGDSDRRRRVGQRRCKNLRFAYDHVFDADCGTECVFEKTTRPLIDFVCSGYAATVFAYGATGSGKTHTMLGSAASGPGVMPLAIEALFDAMSKQDEEHTFSLRLSYLEVYNECIRDLLAPNTGEPMTPALAAGAGEDSAATVRRTKPFKRKDHGLALRHDAKSGVSVVGLSEHEPVHAGEVFEMLERGNARRAVSETAANAQSSRSHAVLQISLRRASRAAGVNDAHQLGKLTLVDLAGSERGSVSRNRGQTLHEGANINRSLLALGNCINALSQPAGKKPRFTHVPYRDSKLTRLLQYSLSGDTKTVMIATVSPAPGCTEDTHNTLKYAHRAKAIQVQATSKTVNVEYHVSRYQAIIASLQSEVAHWKAKASGEGIPRSPAGMLPSLRGSFALPAAGENEGMGLSDEGAQLFAAIDALFSRRTSDRRQLHELSCVSPKPPMKAEIESELKTSLCASESEEQKLLAAIGAIDYPERRALLLQEVRCRQLLLDNASLRWKLATLGHEPEPPPPPPVALPASPSPALEAAAVTSNAEPRDGAASAEDAAAEVAKPPAWEAAAGATNVKTPFPSKRTASGGAVDQRTSAEKDHVSPAGPLTEAGWRANGRASSSGLGVGWLFVGGHSKPGAEAGRPSLMVSQTPLVTKVVGSTALTTAKPITSKRAEGAAIQPSEGPKSTAPPSSQASAAARAAKTTVPAPTKEQAAARAMAHRRSIEDLREIIADQNLNQTAVTVGTAASAQSPSKLRTDKPATERASEKAPPATPTQSAATTSDPTPAPHDRAGGVAHPPDQTSATASKDAPMAVTRPPGKASTSDAAPAAAAAALPPSDPPAAPPANPPAATGAAAVAIGTSSSTGAKAAAGTPTGKPKRFGARAKNALADLLGGLTKPSAKEEASAATAATEQKGMPPAAPPPAAEEAKDHNSPQRKSLAEVRQEAVQRAAEAEKRAAAKLEEARRASTLLMNVVSVVSPTKLPKAPSLSPSDKVDRGSSTPLMMASMAASERSSLDLDLGDQTPELLSPSPEATANAESRRREAPAPASASTKPVLSTQVSLDATLAMEMEAEQSATEKQLFTSGANGRPTTAPSNSARSPAKSAAGGGLSARPHGTPSSRGGANSAAALNRHSSVAGDPAVANSRAVLSLDDHVREDVENASGQQSRPESGKPRWNAASAVAKAPKQAWGAVAGVMAGGSKKGMNTPVAEHPPPAFC